MRLATVLVCFFALGIVGGVSLRKIPGWAETPRATQEQVLGAKTDEVKVVISQNDKKVYLEVGGVRVKEMELNQDTEWIIDKQIWNEWVKEIEKDTNKTGIKVVID